LINRSKTQTPAPAQNKKSEPEGPLYQPEP